jgi:probable HAF family extracellular repeat protein
MAIDLGVLSVHPSEPAASIAYDINASGTVVGQSTDDDRRTVAFTWARETGMRSLGRLSAGHSYSTANAINDAGWVVGVSGGHAVLWKPGEHGIYLAPNELPSSAQDVNNDGVVVGTFSPNPNRLLSSAFRWENGEFRDLGSLDEASSRAGGINNSGTVVGTAYLGIWDAVTWDSFGIRTRLGITPALGGLAAGRDINDRGEVVGVYSPPDQPLSHNVFVWRAGQGATTVASRAEAYSINNGGQIVGSITLTNPAPVLWDPTAGTVWLPGLGGLYGAAHAINDAGWIVGYSENAGRFDRAVLWRRNDAPVARIDGPTTGMKKKPLVLSAAGSTDPDGDALTFSWSFGDGTPAAVGSSVTHEYDDWGSYTVTLIARDVYGLSSSVSAEVTIAPPGQVKRR